MRITHLPTGLVVSQQDEKSQIKNRAKAMKVLRARLYEMEMQKQQDAIAKERRGQVGTGDRSEKIRTYNFPQSRITDHRINFTTHRLHDVLEGDLSELLDQVTSFYNAQKLKEATTVGHEENDAFCTNGWRRRASGWSPRASLAADAAIDVDLFARTILGWDRARVLTARTDRHRQRSSRDSPSGFFAAPTASRPPTSSATASSGDSTSASRPPCSSPAPRANSSSRSRSPSSRR